MIERGRVRTKRVVKDGGEAKKQRKRKKKEDRGTQEVTLGKILDFAS